MRHAGSLFAMADGDLDKAKKAAQRAEAGLSGSFLDNEPPQKGALDDSKLQALLQQKATPSSAAEAADKAILGAGGAAAKERMETFEAQLKEVRDRKQTGKSKEELDIRGTRINAASGEETEWDETSEKAPSPRNKLEEMDAKLKEVLKGGPEKKKKRDDRLKTETGEELLFAEFADMSVISSYAVFRATHMHIHNLHMHTHTYTHIGNIFIRPTGQF